MSYSIEDLGCQSRQPRRSASQLDDIALIVAAVL